MVFTGTYEHAIDKKNRLAIPAEIRGQIQREAAKLEGESVYLYVTLGDEESLSLYTEKSFNRRADELDDSRMDPNELLWFERFFFSQARRVEIDRQGRIRLPEQLLKQVGLSADVVLLGVKDHMEVRDRSTWQEQVTRMLKEKGKLMMNPRQMMRPAGGAHAGGGSQDE